MDRLKRGVDFRNADCRVLRGPPEERKDRRLASGNGVQFRAGIFETGIRRDAAGLENIPPLINVIRDVEIADAFFHRGFVESLPCFISEDPGFAPELSVADLLLHEIRAVFGVSPTDGMRAHDDIGSAWKFLIESRGGAMPAGIRKQVLINTLDSRKTRQVDPVVLDCGGVADTGVRVAVGKIASIEIHLAPGKIHAVFADLLIAAGDPAREHQVRKKCLVALVGCPLPFGTCQQVRLQRVVSVAVIVGRAGRLRRASEEVYKASLDLSEEQLTKFVVINPAYFGIHIAALIKAPAEHGGAAVDAVAGQLLQILAQKVEFLQRIEAGYSVRSRVGGWNGLRGLDGFVFERAVLQERGQKNRAENQAYNCGGSQEGSAESAGLDTGTAGAHGGAVAQNDIREQMSQEEPLRYFAAVGGGLCDRLLHAHFRLLARAKHSGCPACRDRLALRSLHHRRG